MDMSTKITLLERICKKQETINVVAFVFPLKNVYLWS